MSTHELLDKAADTLEDVIDYAEEWAATLDGGERALVAELRAEAKGFRRAAVDRAKHAASSEYPPSGAAQKVPGACVTEGRDTWSPTGQLVNREPEFPEGHTGGMGLLDPADP